MTTALKHETRQQSSSTKGLQLQQPTVAAVTSPSLSLSPAVPRRNLRTQRGECNVGRHGVSGESFRTSVNRHRGLQARRGADTSGTQHDYGKGARASPITRASRAGVAIMNDGIGTRRVILPLGACRFSRYIPIGNAHLGRRSRYQPFPGSGPRS